MYREPKVLSFKVDPYYEVEIEDGQVRVRSFSKVSKGRYLTPQYDGGGYERYKINSKYRHSHKLVANYFLGEHVGLTVNHIDGNKRNNSPDNLELCTRAENIHHAVMMGLHVSGDPKRHGKYTHGKAVKDNLQAYKHEWYCKNKQRLREKSHRNYHTNKEEICRKARDKYRQNRVEILARQKELRDAKKT